MATNNTINFNGIATVSQGGIGTNLLPPANSLVVGNGTSPVTNVGFGLDHSIMMGLTGLAPAFTTTGTPNLSSVSFDAGVTTLSNYAIGTFVPTIIGGSSPGTTTYIAQNGYYTRIGNMAYLQAYIEISAATGTGNALFGGLPFTVNNATGNFWSGTAEMSSTAWSWVAGGSALSFLANSNSTTGSIYIWGTGVGQMQIQMATGAAIFKYSVAYRI